MNVDVNMKDTLDWGTVVVFSCSASCWSGAGGAGVAGGKDVMPYIEEVVVVQAFSEAGLGDSIRRRG